MKKKMLFVIATIAAFALFVPSVMAAEPTYNETIDYGNGKVGTLFFANGTPITVEARTDGEAGALVKWGEDKELAVSEYSTIFGGSHNSETELATTSVIMNGGTVRNIFGGGLHTSYVTDTYVEVNGGTVTGGVSGGGASSFTKNCGHTWYAGDATGATTRVDYAHVVVNAGTTSSVFGGGEGISYTGESYVEINGGTHGYVTGGGSNGFTDDTTVTVYDGEIEVLQAVNRGFTETSEITVFGGTVENAYASAEGDTQELGVTESAALYVYGGEVTNIAPGQSGAYGEAATDVSTLDYVEGTVTNVSDDFDEETLSVYVNFTFASTDENGELVFETFPMLKGSEITVEMKDELIAEIEESLVDSGYVLEGLYTSEDMDTEFEFPVTVEEDMMIYFNIVEESEELPPKTGDLNLVLLIGTIVVAAAGAVIVSKKRFAKSN